MAGVAASGENRPGGLLPLAGTVALVTGGGRGIGAATAVELAQRGAKVVINYLSNAETAEAVVGRIEGGGGSAHAIAGDASSKGDVEALVEATVKKYGGLDVVVACAAIPFVPTPLQDLDWEQFSSKTDSELAAAFHLTKAVLPHLRESDRGRLVYVSSEAAVNANGPGLAAHSTAKAALDAFARCVAVEASSGKLTVNIVSPGLVRTESSDWLPSEFFDQHAEGTLLKRNAYPDDVAAVIGFLAGEDSRYMTGERVSVDGGYRLLG
jgi:3-oxoacyl-[acyl-carrier protein] reductase